ncbi:sugar ABC transporter ATP-binding protein [Pseudonocardia sp.]|uniref:sugar ABC transporter ATP-binding protein n=1 Tax=Pseudonocardia sp. TaxID=60912 RepID=UPI0031FCCBA7
MNLFVAEKLVKSFPGVRALDEATLRLEAGTIHALLGENGAGKSTLIKALSGATQPTAGQVLIDGEPVQFASPAEARRRGVVAIFQELAIEPYMNVASNVVLGDEPVRGPLLNRAAADQRATEVLERLGAASVRPRANAGALTTGQKQLVEIARAVSIDAPLIIMDEPTASLPGSDAENLLRIVRELRDAGKAVVFVSHRLDEIRAVADRVTVLRNGRHIATEPAEDVPVSRMIQLMVGRPVDEVYLAPTTEPGDDVVFRASGLTREGAFEDVSFEVRRGEVLGFAGLIGAGRTEVMRAISGADPYDSGELELDGRPLRIRRPADAVGAGIAYLPEDRKEHGLVLQLSGRENMAMASLPALSPGGIVRRRKLRAQTHAMSERLRIHGNIDAAARTLSGGNQQKLVIGKWIMSDCRLLIFDEPTRGIDVGAKPEVYREMHELAARGAAVIVVSSELPEVMNTSHRMIVMSGGRIADRLDRDEFDEQRILEAAFAAHADVSV